MSKMDKPGAKPFNFLRTFLHGFLIMIQHRNSGVEHIHQSISDNQVLSGIRLTARLLKSGRMVICRGCGDCLREIAQYCWEQRGRAGTPPRKKDDHAMDDLRYFAMDLAGDREEDGFAVLTVEREELL